MATYIVKDSRLINQTHPELSLEIGQEVEVVDEMDDHIWVIEHNFERYQVPQISLHEKWVMPGWMEPYRELISNTGGNSIEDLMNDVITDFFSNSFRATLIACVHSQVTLLHRLHGNNLIK